MTRTSGSFSLSTRAPATPTLIGLQLAVFVGIAFEAPGPDGAATIERLVAWGANFGPLTLSGEWWRLLSCAFVHESFPHIASNLVGLWIAGSLLERRVGTPHFLTIYLCSALFGSLASLAAHPDMVGQGSSAAVLGIFGALLALSIRPRTPATADRSTAILSGLVIASTLLLSAFDASADQAGHGGGLLTGFAFGLALREGVTPETRSRRDWRILGLACASVVLLFAVTSALPRQILVVDSEIRRFEGTTLFLIDRFDAARTENDGDGLPVKTFRRLLEDEILPEARAARARLESLGDVDGAYGRHIDAVRNDALEREGFWESLRVEFEELEELLARIGELEDSINREIGSIHASLEAGTLTPDDAFVLVFDQAVDPWAPLLRSSADEEAFRPAISDRLRALRNYSEMRRDAWALYAESLRDADPELARQANEAHQSTSDWYRSWTDNPSQ
jgi:membrane associated rhomboid family serine protease